MSRVRSRRCKVVFGKEDLMVTGAPVRAFTLFAAICLAMAGCNRQAAQDIAQTGPAPASQQTTDPSIQTSVQARLYADDSLRSEHIDVSVDGGVVTLRGTLSSDTAEQRALSVARGV